MRKIIFTSSIFVFLLVFMGNVSFAQKMTTYTWDTYNVKFQIPTTFHVDKSNSTEFGAGDDDVYLSIFPKSGTSMSFSKMKKSLEDWALDSKVGSYSKVYELENLNGYWGVYLEGTNNSNDLPAFLMLIVHPDYPTISMYVWINYKKSAFDTAEKVLKSFVPTY